MNARTNTQIIHGADGKPAFVVIPYADYVKELPQEDEAYVPHEVVAMMVEHQWTPMRSWREHLNLTQQEVAARIGISQSAYAQQERSTRLRPLSLERIAAALGVSIEQLDF
ncbi:MULTISPECIES: helix-turn-helix transcriptional regulator [unclassified Herbaspirillum]|jgi:DNA-binding XRE family transcriptional regulator|uniref:helix-turn-helix domain-containing protein n=1 Tax=unclassified Herbaspirillum TaxID=2624150 RepID=UPI000555DB3B|nr:MULTISPECIES: helix-turn-helix transcriptional regulator [unclassified Herbaspirillum]MCI1003678.1 helix-turn-helix transcriptional regulator [Herbaspirillum sp. C7C8]NUT60696.1 helix-turn-helix transcriptional regulator [Herbaspirillum sp. C9C3]